MSISVKETLSWPSNTGLSQLWILYLKFLNNSYESYAKIHLSISLQIYLFQPAYCVIQQRLALSTSTQETGFTLQNSTFDTQIFPEIHFKYDEPKYLHETLFHFKNGTEFSFRKESGTLTMTV